MRLPRAGSRSGSKPLVRLRIAPSPAPPFASHVDISDVTSSSRAAAHLARSPISNRNSRSERRSLRPRRLLSCRSRGARARACFVLVRHVISRSAPPSSSACGVRLRSSLVVPLRSRGVGCPEDRSHDLETERATAFPRGLTGACLARRITRARARRARPPPFAPRDAASPTAPRGAASRSSSGASLARYPPTALRIHDVRG
jgi:hypothetical protein